MINTAVKTEDQKLIAELSKFLPRIEKIRCKARIIATDTPLWEYWEEFVPKYLRIGKSKTSIINTRDALFFVIRHCDILTIEKCNNANILEDALFEQKEKRGFSNTSYNSYVKNIKRYFIWLEKQGYIEKNNIGKVSKCKETENEQYTFNAEQVQAIVKQVHDRRQTRLERRRNIFFIDILRFIGARPCEIAALKVSDVTHYKNSYKIKINGAKQKGKARYYPMPSFLRDSYEQYIGIRNDLRPNETSLFISTSKKTGWTQKGMTQFFEKLSNELGFKVVAYAFRRYVASTLYSKTTDMRKIGDYLGHTRASTTLRYVEQCCARTEECGKIMTEINN